MTVRRFQGQNMRVYELARETGVSSAEVLSAAETAGIDAAEEIIRATAEELNIELGVIEEEEIIDIDAVNAEIADLKV